MGGFVAEGWSTLSSPIGRAPHSWGVASNGCAYARRDEVGKLKEYTAEGTVVFIVDMDAREATVIIDGTEFPGVFRGLPKTIFPAASNCRSPAQYTISYGA